MATNKRQLLAGHISAQLVFTKPLALVMAACFVAALLGPAEALAVAEFNARLETSLTLNNKNPNNEKEKDPYIYIGSSFPKPDPKKRKETQPKKGVQTDIGNTANSTEPKETVHTAKGASRKVEGQYSVPEMELQAAGWASGNGGIAELALWASGWQRIKLGNNTGIHHETYGDARDIEFNLTFDAMGSLSAIASPDPQELDLATAKLFYRVIDVETGTELMSANEKVADVMKLIVANEGETKKYPDPPDDPAPLSKDFSVTVPGYTKDSKSGKSIGGKYFLDIEAYVYGSALSIAAKDDETEDETIAREEKIKEIKDRSEQVYPDPDMRLRPEENTIYGDATGHGSWRLDSVAGVSGNDAMAHHGLDTVFLAQTATTLGQPFDVEITLEVPANGAAQVAIETSLFASGSGFGRDYQLVIGTGVGAEFQETSDLEALALFGVTSELPPEVLDGPFTILGTDGMLVSSLSGEFDGSPADTEQLTMQFVANITDIADGVIDGMAQFTIRLLLQGTPGDYNGDGIVDHRDYAEWKSEFGAIGSPAGSGHDGVVDAAGYTVWRDNLGPAVLSLDTHDGRHLTHVASVPEPGIAVLTMVALGLLAQAYRKRRLGCRVSD